MNIHHPKAEQYLKDFGAYCHMYSSGRISWDEFRYAVTELNGYFETQARLVP